MKKKQILLIAFPVLAGLLVFAWIRMHGTKEAPQEHAQESEEESTARPEEILAVLSEAMEKRADRVDISEWKVRREDFRKMTFVWYYDPEIFYGKISASFCAISSRMYV